MADALHAWATEVQRKSGGRVTRAETIHLTLAFLGDVEEERVSILRKLRVRGRRRRLPIEQARYWTRNRIVWVGPSETPGALLDLVSALESELKDHQFRTEERKFAAHITLIRKARDPGRLPSLPDVEWPVEEVVLVRSHLSAEGSRYEVLERYPLG